MTALNAILRSVFDFLQMPLRGMSPFFGVLLWSALTGVLMLLVFKWASDQEKITAAKKPLHACIYEIRLFNDDLRAIMRAQVELVGHNLAYIQLTLKPVLIMMVPLILMLGQLHYFYNYRGLAPGEGTLLTVELGDDWEAGNAGSRPEYALEVPPGLRVETPGAWFPSLKRIMWRLSAEAEGEYDLKVTVDGEAYTKELSVSDAVVRRSPVRPDRGVLAQFLYPAEAPLPATSPVESISVTYTEAEVWLLGWHTYWWIVYFVLAMVIAYAIRKPFGVTF